MRQRIYLVGSPVSVGDLAALCMEPHGSLEEIVRSGDRGALELVVTVDDDAKLADVCHRLRQRAKELGITLQIKPLH